MPKKLPKGIKVTRDGGLIIHPAADTSEGSSIRVPQVTTALGAGFGDAIGDVDREFAATREPVAHFLTFGVAADVVDKWFVVDDPDTEHSDPKIDEAVQDALTQLKTKECLRAALEYERIYGWSLIVGSFSDVADVKKLEKPLASSSQLLQLSSYPKTKVDVWSKDEDENSERFGEPIIYKVERGYGKFLYVHHSRCCKVQTRTNAKSVLDPIWDDSTCGRNIRWGAGQWMYRTGGGFPVIKFPTGTTKEKLEEWVDSPAFTNLMSRTYIGITGDMDFKFEGAAGRALDPQPFFRTNLEQIAAGSGIPEPILRGAQAGALTGSEVNQQQYFKLINRIQSSLESTVRWVIDKLAEAGQIKGLSLTSDVSLPDKIKRWIRHDAQPLPKRFNYEVEWVSAFELDEVKEAQAKNLREDANVKRLEYMTVDEVRALNDLDALPNGEGATFRKPEPSPFGFEETGDSYVVTPIQKRVSSSSESSGRDSEET